MTYLNVVRSMTVILLEPRRDCEFVPARRLFAESPLVFVEFPTHFHYALINIGNRVLNRLAIRQHARRGRRLRRALSSVGHLTPANRCKRRRG